MTWKTWPAVMTSSRVCCGDSEFANRAEWANFGGVRAADCKRSTIRRFRRCDCGSDSLLYPRVREQAGEWEFKSNGASRKKPCAFADSSRGNRK